MISKKHKIYSPEAGLLFIDMAARLQYNNPE